MRVAVVYFPSSDRKRILGISKALSAGIERQGHTVDIIDASIDVNTRLSAYQYIAIGYASSSQFQVKIPEKAQQYIRNSGMIGGKRCFAFTTQTLRGQKRLRNLMEVMESCGMFIKFSDILSDAEAARVVGERLDIG